MKKITDKRAGVASGTLFCYFKTRGELNRALYREFRAQSDIVALENSAEDMAIPERLIQAFPRILRYCLANPKEFKFVEPYRFSLLFERGRSTSGENEHLPNLLIHVREQKINKDAPLLMLESIGFGASTFQAKEHASRGTPVKEELIQQ